MTFKIAAFTVIAGLALASPALAQQGGQIERLLQSDANGDGAISRAEAQDMRAGVFDRLDANSDGHISADERPAQGQQGQGMRGGDMLARADSNSDGRISRSEYLSQPQRAFDRFDANENDLLEPSEIERLRAALARFGNRG
jgi:Ca2+-binding EF-hand superfamily protein